MLDGKVILVKSERCYGFIASRYVDGQVFFHFDKGRCLSSLAPVVLTEKMPAAPAVGQKVHFEVANGPKGPFAVWWSPEPKKAKPEKFRLVYRTGWQVSKFHDETRLRLKPLWEGEDVAELRSKFPREQHPVFNKPDRELAVQKLESGSWVKTFDPR
jgi:cold shock CspA family protein